MKRLAEFYVRHAGLIGFGYCAVPVLIWYVIQTFAIPFRDVYAVRFGISIIAGGTLAAMANRFGVSMWVAKHRSALGPATVLDGAFLGVTTGMAATIVPPFCALIASHHLEEAKTLIVSCWVAGIVLGAVVGACLAAAGRKHLDRGVPNP